MDPPFNLAGNSVQLSRAWIIGQGSRMARFPATDDQREGPRPSELHFTSRRAQFVRSLGAERSLLSFALLLCEFPHALLTLPPFNLRSLIRFHACRCQSLM